MLVTDSEGSRQLTRSLSYCPFDKCADSERCSLYVSLILHYDNMVYGGATALPGSQAVGQVSGNHVLFFPNGKTILPVQNLFSG